jgi:hypothetical protein
MTTTPEPKIPGTGHPITIEPTGVRVVARVGAQIIADTTRALTLREANYPPVQYIPLEDVDQALLTASATQTYCPVQGRRVLLQHHRRRPTARRGVVLPASRTTPSRTSPATSPSTPTRCHYGQLVRNGNVLPWAPGR